MEEQILSSGFDNKFLSAQINHRSSLTPEVFIDEQF